MEREQGIAYSIPAELIIPFILYDNINLNKLQEAGREKKKKRQ